MRGRVRAWEVRIKSDKGDESNNERGRERERQKGLGFAWESGAPMSGGRPLRAGVAPGSSPPPAPARHWALAQPTITIRCSAFAPSPFTAIRIAGGDRERGGERGELFDSAYVTEEKI